MAFWRIEYTRASTAPASSFEIAPTALRALQRRLARRPERIPPLGSTWHGRRCPVQMVPEGVQLPPALAWGNDLRNEQTGQWRIEEVIAADREFFGCLDYLHIFDFGESRVYGRVGTTVTTRSWALRGDGRRHRARQAARRRWASTSRATCATSAPSGAATTCCVAIQTAKAELLLYSPGGPSTRCAPRRKGGATTGGDLSARGRRDPPQRHASISSAS